MDRLEKFEKIKNFIETPQISSSIYAKRMDLFENSSSLGWSNMFRYNTSASIFELREYLINNIAKILNPHIKGTIVHARDNEYDSKINHSYEPEQLKRTLDAINNTFDFVPHTNVKFVGFMTTK